MHYKGEISSFREKKKDSKIYRRISLFLSTMVFLTKKILDLKLNSLEKYTELHFSKDVNWRPSSLP